MAEHELRRLHHFRPVLHLRHFADAEDLIWVYDRQAPTKPFRQKVSRVAAEKYLYSPLSGEHPRDDTMETWLADCVDGPAAAPLGKVIQNLPFAHGERSALSAYIGVQDLRTPAMRDILVPSFQRGMEAEYKKLTADHEAIRQDILRDQGIDISVEDIATLVDMYTVDVNKGVWLEFIERNTNKLGRRIYHMAWTRMLAPPPFAFLTNDIGVAKGYGDPPVLAPYAPGFAAGRTHWIVPLSTDVALLLNPSGHDHDGHITPEVASAINNRLIKDAKRFVYSRDADETISATLAAP